MCLSLSQVQFSMAIACQAPLSTGFPRQKYWSGLPFPSPGDLPDPGIGSASPIFSKLAGEFFTWWANRKALIMIMDKGKLLFLNVSALGSTNMWVYGTYLVAEMVKNLTSQQRLYFYLAICIFISKSPSYLPYHHWKEQSRNIFPFYLNSQH